MKAMSEFFSHISPEIYQENYIFFRPFKDGNSFVYGDGGPPITFISSVCSDFNSVLYTGVRKERKEKKKKLGH